MGWRAAINKQEADSTEENDGWVPNRQVSHLHNGKNYEPRIGETGDTGPMDIVGKDFV